MAPKFFGFAILVATTIFATSAVAQDRNELTGIIGRTFISDQGVRGARLVPTRSYTPGMG